MDTREVVRAASSDPTADWADRSDSSHPALRKQTDSRLDRDRDADDAVSKSSAVISYTRTARHERTTTYERSSSSRYVDQCSESKYRSHARRSPDREYGREEDGDEYYPHSSKSGSRYHSDQHSYYSSSYPHSSSHQSNHHSYRSDHYRERHRRSPSESRKRTYRDEEYSRGVDRHSGLDRDDHRVRKVDANNSYYKSSSSTSEKLTSNSHRISSNRVRAEDSRPAIRMPVSPSSRFTSSKRSTVVRTFGDWEEHVSSSHKLYYYNRVSGVSQWEKPRHLNQSAHPHDGEADVRAKSPAAARQRNHVVEVVISDDDDDVFDRKRSRRPAAAAKDEAQPKSQSSHITYNQNSGHADHRSSRCASHLKPDSHSRSHSLLDRSSSVQSSSSGSSLRNERRRRADDEDRRRPQQRVRSTNFIDQDPAESSRSLKRKTSDLTSERLNSRVDHPVISENGVRCRTGTGLVDESNGCSNQRKKVLLNSPLNHHPELMTIKKETESIATSSDHSSSSGNRSQCLSPSQVTMDNLEKIIDSLADTPGLPDLRKLSREDALKTIQQVLRIMKEASLGIAARTPVSPAAASNASARSSHPNSRSRLPLVRASNQVVDHEPAINGGSGVPESAGPDHPVPVVGNQRLLVHQVAVRLRGRHRCSVEAVCAFSHCDARQLLPGGPH